MSQDLGRLLLVEEITKSSNQRDDKAEAKRRLLQALAERGYYLPGTAAQLSDPNLPRGTAVVIPPFVSMPANLAGRPLNRAMLANLIEQESMKDLQRLSRQFAARRN